MSPEVVIGTAQQALSVATLLVLVLLVPALLVGLLVSMFQAATQINEMTLSFLPRLLVTLAVLMVAGPMLLEIITGFMRELIESIPYLIG